ncbi:MAG: hypothetical protein ABIO80_02685 [Sphingomicrobium sp.]
MNNLLIALTCVVILVLVHYVIVDFRFRFSGGITGIWLHNPAPVGLWVARLTAIPPLIAALSIKFVGTGETVWIVLGVLSMIHFLSLFMLRAFVIEE